MNLKHLTDNQLLLDIKSLVENERHSMMNVLYHFKEIETRKLFCDLNFPSMLEYAVKELNYSEPAAMRRIHATRIMIEFPVTEPKIESGRLTLTNINLAVNYFRKEKIKESSRKLDVLSRIEGKTKNECVKILFELTPKPLPNESIQQVSLNHVQLKINIRDETHKKLDDVKSLMGFHIIDDAFFEAIADEAKDNILRKRFKLTSKGRKTASTGVNPSNYERRTAYENAEEKVCENCGSLFLLQEDHRFSKALGGSNDPLNLRLLCYNCNQRARIRAKL